MMSLGFRYLQGPPLKQHFLREPCSYDRVSFTVVKRGCSVTWYRELTQKPRLREPPNALDLIR